MVDIQSAAAEIRRGKQDRRKKPQDKNIMVCPIPQGDNNNTRNKSTTQNTVIAIAVQDRRRNYCNGTVKNVKIKSDFFEKKTGI